MHRRTKIVCTIGPAVSSEEKIDQLISAGMNVARLNFSHGTREDHAKTIANLKKLRKKREIPLAIMLDTKGPEIRVGKLIQEQLELKKRDKLKLVKGEAKESLEVPITPASVVDDLEEGMHVLFDDGYISAKVIEKSKDFVTVQIENPGVLLSNKGINIPHENIDLPAMTEQDMADIRFGCEQDVDIIAASFIRSAEHILEIKQLLAKEKAQDIMVMAKIESAEGVNHFDSILQAADGIMVARGDLGVELPLKDVPRLQKMMIRKCYHSGKSVIIATQMLESMITNPRPTRAEVSDVANAIYDSASAVMLSGETAVGKYPIEAVKMMRSVIEEAESDFDYRSFFYSDTRGDFYDVATSVGLASVKTAYAIDAKAIFVFTHSGNAARTIARLRPYQPIIALSPTQKTYHQMGVNWGVVPFFGEVKDLKSGFATLSCFALKKKLTRYGDLVVVSAGSPFGISGTTNTMIVENIGDVLVRGYATKKGKRTVGKVLIVLSTENKRQYHIQGKVAVLTACDTEYEKLLHGTAGIILQNHPDDLESEKCAKALAKNLNVPLITRADNASTILQEGQLVTLDPQKGLVFKGSFSTDDEMIHQVCCDD
ncbi:MAG: pyruvate kinase [Candidatus Algichlamydia australiensis]|nr:pyruvate kinase [Chlamydiales bacterium]